MARAMVITAVGLMFLPFSAFGQVRFAPASALNVPESQPIPLPQETPINMMQFPPLENMHFYDAPVMRFEHAPTLEDKPVKGFSDGGRRQEQNS